MIRKFLEGLAFGAGFTLAFLILSGISTLLFTRTVFDDSSVVHRPPAAAEPVEFSDVTGPQFHELTLEEKIREASAIAVVRYQPAEDGRVIGVVREILKRTPGTEFHFEIGDEYPDATYYPGGNIGHGDGQVVFTGSPAESRYSATFEGDRVGGLAHIPLKLLREKCAAQAP